MCLLFVHSWGSVTGYNIRSLYKWTKRKARILKQDFYYLEARDEYNPMKMACAWWIYVQAESKENEIKIDCTAVCRSLCMRSIF